MNRKAAAILILVGFGSLGCADSSSFVRGDPSTQAKLTTETSVYVAVPDNGTYGDKVYASSGKATASAILAAFVERSQFVRLGGQLEDRVTALESARKGGEQVVAFSSILHWEDRATEWSGKPDRVRVHIEILDAETGQPLDSATIEGTSGLGTFGGDHPQDLLAAPLEAFILSLYPS
jgi:hypothetical protein